MAHREAISIAEQLRTNRSRRAEGYVLTSQPDYEERCTEMSRYLSEQRLRPSHNSSGDGSTGEAAGRVRGGLACPLPHRPFRSPPGTTSAFLEYHRQSAQLREQEQAASGGGFLAYLRKRVCATSPRVLWVVAILFILNIRRVVFVCQQLFATAGGAPAVNLSVQMPSDLGAMHSVVGSDSCEL